MNNADDDGASVARAAILKDLLALGIWDPQPGDGWPKLKDLRALPGVPARRPRHPSEINDAVLEVLQYVPQITRLELSSTRITDAGLKALRYLPHLASISLENTDVGDEGVRELVNHRGLRYFSAMHSRVTIHGERFIRARFPECDASIGRKARRGEVFEVRGDWLMVRTLSGNEIPAVVMRRQKHPECVTNLLRDPVGRKVIVLLGLDDELNWISHEIPAALLQKFSSPLV